jgi:CCR4-NOT transcription complex subunit 7/8
MNKKPSTKDLIIKDVDFDNFDVEMRKISRLVEKYNYISLDTEFPGFIFSGQGMTHREIYYDSIRSNVNNLKLIQVGLTLCDEHGQFPAHTSTWQFNFHFDLNKDVYSSESIELLSKSGINFDKLISKGISMEKFAEWLISSGLILNEDITWISFHGAYDFAYLLKILTNLPLPDNESSFLEQVAIYFPVYYDVRFLVKKDNFRGSLSKLAQGLEINRIGTQHQAGSDSIVTSEIFFRLRRSNDFDDIFIKGKNVLFGLGFGGDEKETIIFNNENNLKNSLYSHNFPNANNMINDNVYNFHPAFHPIHTMRNLFNLNTYNTPYNNNHSNNQQYFRNSHSGHGFNAFNQPSKGYEYVQF